MANIGILVVHGIGSTGEGYSSRFQKKIESKLKSLNSPRVIHWQEVYWGNELAWREEDLWLHMQNAKDRKGKKIPLDWKWLREELLFSFADALSYNREGVNPSTGKYPENSTYTKIHTTISFHIGELQTKLTETNQEGAPIVVLAHSFGGHIMSNYIWDRQLIANIKPPKEDPFAKIPNLLAMITFGCNIPLFSLSFSRIAEPIDLPGQGINDEMKEKAKWLNFLDRDDVLGWPLKPLYEKDVGQLTPAQQHTVSIIEDSEINVGKLATRWNPLSHREYWRDSDFIDPVAEYLR